jgi:hypothetical protein
MKWWLESFILATLLAAHAFATESEPRVVYFQQKVSVDAKSIPLSRLLRLWDEATGMRSSVPRELASQTVTVKFSELPLDEAVRRIFEKLPLDYVFIEARGIIVTGRSQAPAAPAAAEVPPVNEGAPEAANPLPQKKPNAPALKPPPPPILTPFGPIPNTGEKPVIELPPVPGAPPPPPFFAPTAPFAPLPDSGENPVLELPPVPGAPPPPQFFAPAPPPPPVPPVYTQDDLFRPLSIYRDPSVPPPSPPSPPLK